MTTSLPTDLTTANARPAVPHVTRRKWLREPLLHFLIFGAALFALDQALLAQRGDERVILLNAGADQELRTLFSEDRGREPTAEELEILRQRWFDNELLYREGLEMGLDRGDTGIRERVIFKALSVVQSNLRVPEIDEAGLQAWFEARRGIYDAPPRIDFLEAVMPGKPAMSEVEVFAQTLNARSGGEVESGLRVYRGRPLPSIAPVFGERFAAQLGELPLNQWIALDSTEGPRAIRIESRIDGRAVTLDEVREKVVLDWRDAKMAELRTEVVRKLADKYTLRVAEAKR